MDCFDHQLKISSISIKLSLPRDKFTLYALDNDPLSLQAELALEYKAKFYSCIEFDIKKVNFLNILNIEKEFHTDKNFSQCYPSNTSFARHFPYLRILNSLNQDVFWANNMEEIFQFFDYAYPQNCLLHQDNKKTYFENKLLSNWINQSCKIAYYSLLLLNNKELLQHPPLESSNGKFSLTPLWAGGRIKAYLKHMLNLIDAEFNGNRDLAYDKSIKSLEFDILPAMEEKLNERTSKKYLLGDTISSSDIILYSYLKCFMNLKEKDCIQKFTNLVQFIQFIESKDLNKVKSSHKDQTSQRITYLKKENLQYHQI